MKFTFIGKDGSMGLIKGRGYHLRAMAGVFKKYPIVIEITTPPTLTNIICPYSSLEAFFQNWELPLK